MLSWRTEGKGCKNSLMHQRKHLIMLICPEFSLLKVKKEGKKNLYRRVHSLIETNAGLNVSPGSP